MASEDAPSALYLHSIKVYEEMYKNAKRVQADGHTTMVMYEGMFTKLVTETLGLPVPYYTKIRASLMAMGCIRPLRRGGGTSPSQWELITSPTPELWADLEVVTPPQGLDAQLLQMLSDLSRRTLRVERALGIQDMPLPREDNARLGDASGT